MSTLSTMQSSPWQFGLDELADFGAMRRKIVMPAIQAEGLQTLPVEKACEVLKTSFKNIFVPSDAHCEILGRCVGRISAFTSSNYPDVRTYLERINSEVKVGEYQVMCLTGVAGLGKSQLLKALERLLPAPRTIHLNDAYQAINIHFTRRAEFNVLSAARDTLRSLANPSFVANRGAIVRSELERHLRQWFYSQGVSLLVLDELQFLTQSNTANTLVANMLMMLGGLGVPVIFISNYSMAHRIVKRPQEERQRLLSEPVVLHPESPESPDWLALVREYVKVDPETLRIDPARDAAELNRLTAGIPRLLRILFVIAFRVACNRGSTRVVSMTEIKIAYQSAAFCIQRADVEALASLAISQHLARTRTDLVCPFPVPLPMRSSQKPDAKCNPSSPDYQAVTHMRESALSTGGRALLKDIRGDAEAKKLAASSGKPKPKKIKVTAESLYAGAQALRDRESSASRMADKKPSNQEV
jgi:energy-coupling factor transporter ATP-binding protein EcfA2